MPTKRGEQIFKMVNARETLERLTAARERARLSLSQAADLADVGVSQLSRIERGEQKFYGATIRGRLEKLFSALDGAGTPEFVLADWRAENGKRMRRRALRAAEQEKVEMFVAPAPASTASADEKFDLLSTLLAANKQGALSVEQTKALMAQVLK